MRANTDDIPVILRKRAKKIERYLEAKGSQWSSISDVAQYCSGGSDGVVSNQGVVAVWKFIDNEIKIEKGRTFIRLSPRRLKPELPTVEDLK
jgi:hypothetical protein